MIWRGWSKAKNGQSRTNCPVAPSSAVGQNAGTSCEGCWIILSNEMLLDNQNILKALTWRLFQSHSLGRVLVTLVQYSWKWLIFHSLIISGLVVEHAWLSGAVDDLFSRLIFLSSIDIWNPIHYPVLTKHVQVSLKFSMSFSTSSPLGAGRGTSAGICVLDDVFLLDGLGSGLYTPFIIYLHTKRHTY